MPPCCRHPIRRPVSRAWGTGHPGGNRLASTCRRRILVFVDAEAGLDRRRVGALHLAQTGVRDDMDLSRDLAHTSVVLGVGDDADLR